MSVRRGIVWAAALAVSLVSAANAQRVPDGFRVTTAFANLNAPTAVRFAADGRVFVAEKSGIVKVFDSLDDGSPSVFADLRTNVHNFWDRGLLGLALHPDFPSTPFVYVLYTFDAAIGGTAPRWGAPGATSDGCPDPPGAQGHGCVVSGRLSRLRANGNRALSEEVLLEQWCQQFPGHSVASIAFDSAGHLYLTAGDGASWTFVDYGQRGIPPNPCGDPPADVGGDLTPPTSQGGALRSQLLEPGSSGTVTYDGKVLRLDDAGNPAPGNPLSESAGAGAARIVARGLREPFRIAIRPGTNELWFGDVGWNDWEEINRLEDPSGPVENFGWPCFEGFGRQPAYDSTGLAVCQALYASGGAIAPYFTYNHLERVVPGELCEPGTSSVSGLVFYDGGTFPPEYGGALFFADYSRSCIWAMLAGDNGLPDPNRRITFASGAAGVVDLVVGPGGDLFYPDIINGAVRRISSTRQNQPPVARLSANRTSGPVPLAVTFDASDSSDADGPFPLSFDWDLNGDGSFGDAGGETASFTYSTPGLFRVVVRVRDAGGAATTAEIEIEAGEDEPPTARIDAPAEGSMWRVGETVQFSGGGDDPEQGALPASSFAWELILHHCPDNCHTHLVQTFEGVTASSFVAPDHEYPSHLELRLTVTDSAGQTGTSSVMIHPDTVELTFDSEPSGLEVSIGSASFLTPFSRTVMVGSENGIAATDPQEGECVSYRFVSWSDGGDRSHIITAPPQPVTLTATFEATSTCQLPVAVISATPQAGPVPLDVEFDASESFDPDQGSIVSFDWDLDGDGSFGDASVATPRFTYGEPGLFTVAVRVTDADGESGMETIVIRALNSCPGDCNDDLFVAVDELVLLVRAALFDEPTSLCPSGDSDGDGVLTIDDLVAAVGSSMQGCAAAAMAQAQ